MISEKKIYLLIITFVVLNILLIFLLISPLLNRIQANSKDIIFQKNNLSSLIKETQELKENKELYDLIFVNLERINKLFIDPEIPIDFIDFLEKEAAIAQLSIEISPIANPKGGNESWTGLSFQLETEGSFPNFLKFLDRIENSPYLLEILNLNLRGLTGRGKEKVIHKINATFTMKVFTR